MGETDLLEMEIKQLSKVVETETNNKTEKKEDTGNEEENTKKLK